MAESSRDLTKDFLEIQSRMLGLDLSAVDADALLDRVRSGLDDLDRANELSPGGHEPAVTFSARQDDQ